MDKTGEPDEEALGVLFERARQGDLWALDRVLDLCRPHLQRIFLCDRSATDSKARNKDLSPLNLNAKFASMPEPIQKAMYMRFHLEADYPQVARECGFPTAAEARRRLHAALRSLYD